MVLFDVQVVLIRVELIIFMPIHWFIKKEVKILFITLIKFLQIFKIILAMKLHYGDLNDSSSLVKIISSTKPTEIYNLGAMSHVKVNIILKLLSKN